MTSLEFSDLTGEIIGAAIEVHKELGSGFVETIYENALVIEVRRRGVKVLQQMEVVVYYHGIAVGTHRLDLFVGDKIVVELKAVKTLDNVHFAFVKSYLKAVGQNHGLLINFAKPVLEVKRVYYGPFGIMDVKSV